VAREDYPYKNPPRLPEGDEVDLRAFLGSGNGPIDLEIGPGMGAFILERAAAIPELRILGLEIRRKWSTVLNNRLDNLGYHPRAQVVCEDARAALSRLQPDAIVDRAFVHFPDPWWKKRHQKRLVLVEPLLDQIARLLRDDGELFVQTDVEDRAQEYTTRLLSHPLLEPAGDTGDNPALASNPYEGRSNREKRCAQDGLPVFRMRMRRQPRPS